MASRKEWKLEAWKAGVSLTEKVFLVFLAAVVIPVLLQRGAFPTSVVTIGSILSGAVFIFWLVLVLRGYFKFGETKHGR